MPCGSWQLPHAARMLHAHAHRHHHLPTLVCTYLLAGQLCPLQGRRYLTQSPLHSGVSLHAQQAPHTCICTLLQLHTLWRLRTAALPFPGASQDAAAQELHALGPVGAAPGKAAAASGRGSWGRRRGASLQRKEGRTRVTVVVVVDGRAGTQEHGGTRMSTRTCRCLAPTPGTYPCIPSEPCHALVHTHGRQTTTHAACVQPPHLGSGTSLLCSGCCG